MENLLSTRPWKGHEMLDVRRTGAESTQRRSIGRPAHCRDESNDKKAARNLKRRVAGVFVRNTVLDKMQRNSE
jgi:hypothetical protein